MPSNGRPPAPPLTVESVVPLYHRVYTALRQQLLEGRFPAGRPLPGELQIAKHFGVARVTVRRALQHLEGEGLVSRQASRGTFATGSASSDVRANISGLLENLVTVGRRTGARLVSLGPARTPPELATRLGEETTLRIVRVRLAGRTPVAQYTHFLPARTAAAIRRATLGAHPVLSLLQEAGFTPASAEQALSARAAETAVASALDVPVGAALICLKRLVCDEADQVLEYHEALYRADRYEYRLNLVRGGSPAAPAWVPLVEEGSGG